MLLAVTGATGFLGRAFVPAALALGHRVRALVRPERAASGLAGAELVPGALGDRDAVARLVADADCVVHLAALGVQARDRDWSRMIEVDVVQPLGLVEEAARAGVKRLVAVGTVLEYGGHGHLPEDRADADARVGEGGPIQPEDPYGAAKAAGGVLLRSRVHALGLPCWYLRVCAVYGPADDPDKVLPAAIRAARGRRRLEMTAGEQVREWLWIDDAVRALLAAAAEHPDDGAAVVNVGTGEGLVLADVVRAAYRAAGADPALVQAGALPYRPREVHRLVMDVSRAERLLGFRARVGLADGLRTLVGTVQEEARRG